MLTGITAHPGESVFQNPASEELLDHLNDHRTPVSPPPSEPLVVDCAKLLEVILEETVE